MPPINKFSKWLLPVIFLGIYIWISMPYFRLFCGVRYYDDIYKNLSYNDYYVGTLAVLSLVSSVYYFEGRRKVKESEQIYVNNLISETFRNLDSVFEIVYFNSFEVESKDVYQISDRINSVRECIRVLLNDKSFVKYYSENELIKIQNNVNTIYDILTDDKLVRKPVKISTTKTSDNQVIFQDAITARNELYKLLIRKTF